MTTLSDMFNMKGGVKSTSGTTKPEASVKSEMSGSQPSYKGQIPWIEKYRPESIDDVSHQEEVVRALRRAIVTGSMPHLLFYGPPGTGKTSTILALAKSLFGKALWKDRVLELNASDERGIAVVRNKIKKIAQYAAGATTYTEYGARGDDAMDHDGVEHKVPGFKLIILDEADALTRDAQAALRRVMEDCSATTRFCIICNNVTRIIDPITSRCSKFRFQALPVDSQVARMRTIVDSEGLGGAVSDQVLRQIVELTEGDLRRAINTLQAACSVGAETVSVSELCGNVPEGVVNQVLEAIESPKLNVAQLMELGNSLIVSQGFSVMQFIHQLSNKLVHKPYGLAATPFVALAESRIVEGADEALNLFYVLTQIQSLCNKPK